MIAYGDYKIRFKNDHVIYEQVVKCSIKDYEFNCSYNPSLQTSIVSGSSNVVNGNGVLKDFATGSFSPYLTTIGLYNDSNELLAVGKLSQPLPLSDKTDTNIFIKWDM